MRRTPWPMGLRRPTCTMYMSGMITTHRLLRGALVVAGAAAWAGFGAGSGAAATPGPTATIWVQTMDSCKQALGGASYLLTGPGVSQHADTPPATKVRVSNGALCPLQQGNCASVHVGCASFTAVPPGTYRLHETRTPAADTSNPEGYAPCEGGSACRSEVAAVTVDAAGAVQATVTNVYPDGFTSTWPSGSGHRHGRTGYAANPADPIVFHDFGLAPPGRGNQCDGDSDADDHLTGTPSAHCAYPENEEDAACKPFPWSCTMQPAATEDRVR